MILCIGKWYASYSLVKSLTGTELNYNDLSEYRELLDYRAFGLLSCRTIELSDYRAVRLSTCRTIELSDY